MNVLDQLLQLEGEKHRALLACDAAAYETHVAGQLQLLDGGTPLETLARSAPETIKVLSRLIQLNTALLLNQFISSPVSRLNVLAGAVYDSSGSLAASPQTKFSLKG